MKKLQTYLIEIKQKGFLRFYRKRYLYLLNRLFDWSRGIKTIGDVTVDELDISETGLKVHARQYSSINIKDLKIIFSHIYPVPESVLLDYGCGKGRVLFAAAECGVMDCRGIEISSKLCKIALKNLDSYSRKSDQMKFEIIK